MHRNTISIMVVCLLGVWVGLPVAALAQEGDGTAAAPDTRKRVELTAGQVELINQGAIASDEGDYLKARRALRAALEFSEFNLAYLNRGRALQKAGRCAESLAMYDKALVAPLAVGLEPEQVEAAVRKYRAELVQECVGTLTLVCRPEGVEVTLTPGEGGAQVGPQACSDALPPLAPGPWTVRAVRGPAQVELKVEMVALQAQELTVNLEGGAAAKPGEDLGGAGVRASEDVGGGGFVEIGVRYLSQVGYGGGQAYETDGDTPLDVAPPAGQPDTRDALELSRLGHGLEVDAGWGEGPWWVGAIGHLQLPTLGVDAGVAGRWSPYRSGQLEARLGGQLTYGGIDQVMGNEVKRYVTHAGPVVVGAVGGLVWWLAPTWGVGTGLDVRVGVPDLGVVGNWTTGVELRL